MGKCPRSCSKRRRPPSPVAATEHLTLRSGRVVPAAAACSPRMRGRHRSSAGSGRRCAKRECGSPRRKSAAAASPHGRVLGSQLSGGRPEELLSSIRPNTPPAGDVVKREHESKGGAGQPSQSPSEAEVEAFVAAAELAERRRFAETYNYDVALDRPLEGRFEWAPVST